MRIFISRDFSRLVLAITAVAGVWLIALPWIARLPVENDRWQTLQDAGIDPSAMYYSELEAMEPILQKINLNGRTR